MLALAKLKGKFREYAYLRHQSRRHRPSRSRRGRDRRVEFFRVLRDLTYDGYLGLDLGKREDLAGGYIKSLT